MRTFPLQIGTPDGLLFQGEAERVVCRSITGDLAILAGHCNFCTALGMGEAHVVLPDGTTVLTGQTACAYLGGDVLICEEGLLTLDGRWLYQEKEGAVS